MKANRIFTDEELNAIDATREESAFEDIMDNLESLFDESPLYFAMFFYFYTKEKEGGYSLFSDEVAICFALSFVTERMITKGADKRQLAAIFLNHVQNNIAKIAEFF